MICFLGVRSCVGPCAILMLQNVEQLKTLLHLITAFSLREQLLLLLLFGVVVVVVVVVLES